MSIVLIVSGAVTLNRHCVLKVCCGGGENNNFFLVIFLLMIPEKFLFWMKGHSFRNYILLFCFEGRYFLLEAF